MIGRNLLHYEVLEELGRGGMGVVYKARDTSLNRLVALKLLPPELADDPARVAMLRQEAQATARLNHPRIVTTYAIEEAAGQLFMTMEYVEGRTLGRAIPKNGFDLDRFLKIAIPLADAVATAHDRQIVHRDLKPGNILLDKDDRPKILDFGLARLRPDDPDPYGGEAGEALDGGALEGGALKGGALEGGALEGGAITRAETLEGRLAGTPLYMSPEQLGHRQVDHRSDIFSLGVIYYEMATGRHPHRSGQAPVAASMRHDSPPSVADVRLQLPRQLGRIIGRCLEKNPQERIQSAKDLRNDLEDLRQELANPAPVVAASGRRRRLALALPVAAVVAAGGWLLYGRSGDGEAAAPPRHLAVEPARLLPGERGPDYLRHGLLETLRRRLAGLEGVYVLGKRGPPPDLTVEMDARRLGDTVAVSFRLREAGSPDAVGDGAVEGGSAELPELVERSARAIAALLDRRPDLTVAYRPSAPPTRNAAAFDLYLRAVAAAGAGAGFDDRESARRLLAEALQRDPAFALPHLLAGQLDLDDHRTDPESGLAGSAERHCRAAIEWDPALGAAHACLGEALLLDERSQEAVSPLVRAIELDASDLGSRERLRDAFRSLAVQASADATWRRLIARHPDHWAGHYSLGRFYQDSERYEAALAAYQRALELAPLEPDVHRFLGTVYLYLGRFEEAEVALRRSIQIRPTWDAFYNLGGLYFNLRRFAAAVAAYEQAVELDDSSYRSAGRLGWACYWAPGRRQDAALHLRRAIELADPADPDARILSALFLAMLGEREASLEALQRALELQPNNPHYFYLAALSANHLGDSAGAIEWLRRAVRGGFSTAEIRTVIDLENLSDDPRFQRLLREADSATSEAR